MIDVIVLTFDTHDAVGLKHTVVFKIGNIIFIISISSKMVEENSRIVMVVGRGK